MMWGVQLLEPALTGQRAGDWFHFWDRQTYGEPQFGDSHHAKRYASKGGAASRAHYLQRLGYSVAVVLHPAT